MKKQIKMLWQLSNTYGPVWLAARLIYEFQGRSGFQLLRFPRRPWADEELGRRLHPDAPSNPVDYAVYRRQHCPSFFFQPTDRLAYSESLLQIGNQAGRQTLIDQAEKLGQGYFPYFSAQSGYLGFPPDWHANPFTGQRVSATAHWSRIPMFSAQTGDLKFIWEPGRFAGAYILARAYWLSGNETYAEIFWQLIESWAISNPPHHGPHWKCGQEISLRLIAWCFGLYATLNSPAATPTRLASLVGMIAAQAERIAGDHIYAYLQRNNHAISEGVGLWTVGLLFPELKTAKIWLETGRQILEKEAIRQIYSDGAYVQHSANYHRLMLHDYLWAIRLGELNGQELSSRLQNRVAKAGEFLYQLQDQTSGRVPNYGANDGALILPLNNCNYHDFRPVLGCIHYLFNRTRLYEPGPWDEDLVWLFGPEALASPQAVMEQKPLHAPVGGYYTLRGKKSWGMIRCATFHDRPSQADMLHLDIWYDGQNIACDPGTYLYYATHPWDNGLSATQVHNTVSVDDLDQMERGPRFLWLTWLKSELFYHLTSAGGQMAYFEGAHYGYRRLPRPVIHRRAVLRTDDDIWIVVDDLSGQDKQHIFRLHWLLGDFPFTPDTSQRCVFLNTTKGDYEISVHPCLPETAQYQFDVMYGEDRNILRGWQSPYYGVRYPAPSLVLNLTGAGTCRLVTIFAPKKQSNQLTLSAQQINLVGHNLTLNIDLLPPQSSSIMKNIVLTRSTDQDKLVIERGLKK